MKLKRWSEGGNEYAATIRILPLGAGEENASKEHTYIPKSSTAVYRASPRGTAVSSVALSRSLLRHLDERATGHARRISSFNEDDDDKGSNGGGHHLN